MRIFLFIVTIVTLAVIFCGFDKDNPNFNSVGYTSLSGSFTTDQVIAALPTGFSYLTIYSCLSGFTSVSQGYIKLASSGLSYTSADRDASMAGHKHGPGDLEIDDVKILGSPSHNHTFKHTHKWGHVHGTTTDKVEVMGSSDGCSSSYSTADCEFLTGRLIDQISESVSGKLDYGSISANDYFYTTRALNSSGTAEDSTESSGGAVSLDHTHTADGNYGDFASGVNGNDTSAATVLLGDPSYRKLRLCFKN